MDQNNIPEQAKPELQPDANKEQVGPAETPSVSPAPAPATPPDDSGQIASLNQQIQQTPATSPNDSKQPASAEHHSEGFYLHEAKEVIEKDKEDPYQEEEDHENLQVSYLKDRFNKDVKKS